MAHDHLPPFAGPAARGAHYDHQMAEEMTALLGALEQARGEAAVRVAEFAETMRAYADARGDSDADDEHDPEGSTLAWERATAAASVDVARRHLLEIESALRRLADGWDGACVSCGRPIPGERLAARPSADRCVPCAAAPR